MMDQELPVKIKASIALNSLLTYSSAQEILKPYLANVLEIYMKLME